MERVSNILAAGAAAVAGVGTSVDMFAVSRGLKVVNPETRQSGDQEFTEFGLNSLWALNS